MIKELEHVRYAREIKNRLWIEYQSLIPTAGSPKMDGMPKASGGGSDVNAAIVDLRTEARRRYDDAQRVWRQAEKEARELMTLLPPHLYSLCLYYFISAMTKEQTMAVMHISESTFKRYKADLREYEKMNPV